MYGLCRHVNVVGEGTSHYENRCGASVATACAGAIRITFAWCLAALAQLEATIVTSLSSLAQYVEARQS